MVREQMALIQDVQTDEWWQDVTVPMLEVVRRRLRDLVQADREAAAQADLHRLRGRDGRRDGGRRCPASPTGTDYAKFRAKARAFLRAHQDHIAIHKLRMNKAADGGRSRRAGADARRERRRRRRRTSSRAEDGVARPRAVRALAGRHGSRGGQGGAGGFPRRQDAHREPDRVRQPDRGPPDRARRDERPSRSTSRRSPTSRRAVPRRSSAPRRSTSW